MIEDLIIPVGTPVFWRGEPGVHAGGQYAVVQRVIRGADVVGVGRVLGYAIDTTDGEELLQGVEVPPGELKIDPDPDPGNYLIFEVGGPPSPGIEIEELQRAQLEEGDVLIVRLGGDAPTSEPQVLQMLDELRKSFPNNKCVLLFSDAEISIIRAESDDPEVILPMKGQTTIYDPMEAPE